MSAKQKPEPALADHIEKPGQAELVWRDDKGLPHVADLAEERAAQADRAKSGITDGLPISSVLIKSD